MGSLKNCLKDKDGFVIAKINNFPCDNWKLCTSMVIPDEITDCYYRIEFDEESEKKLSRKKRCSSLLDVYEKKIHRKRLYQYVWFMEFYRRID